MTTMLSFCQPNYESQLIWYKQYKHDEYERCTYTNKSVISTYCQDLINVIILCGTMISHVDVSYISIHLSIYL
jgi:hypothetical protein